MKKDYLKRVQERGQDVNNLFRTLGMRAESIDSNEAVIILPVGEELLQGGDVLAGGILGTLLDEAMAHAALAGLDEDQIVATVDMSVRFFKPVFAGDSLRGVGRVEHKGKSILFTQGEVFNAKGETVAKAGASFMLRRLSPR